MKCFRKNKRIVKWVTPDSSCLLESIKVAFKVKQVRQKNREKEKNYLLWSDDWLKQKWKFSGIFNICLSAELHICLPAFLYIIFVIVGFPTPALSSFSTPFFCIPACAWDNSSASPNKPLCLVEVSSHQSADSEFNTARSRSYSIINVSMFGTWINLKNRHELIFSSQLRAPFPHTQHILKFT